MAYGDRSIDVYVRKLRKKIQPFAGGRTYIHTHFGWGYRFAVEQPIVTSPPKSPDRPASATSRSEADPRLLRPVIS